MKHFIVPIALVAVALATSCNTSKKLYEAKEYDQVIQRNAPKICSGRINRNAVDYVAASYHEANQADHERIQELKASGKPDIWPEVYERYSSMKGRYEALSCFPKALKKSIGYAKLDLDEELNTSKNKAETYLAAKINQVLDEPSPDLEEADRMIRHLESINPEHPRLNDLKLKSLAKQYGDLSRLMHIEVFQRQVSPNRDETVTFKETQGDKTATVTDHKLSKTATIKGKVNFIDPRSKRMLLSMPYEMSSRFEHSYSTVEGAREACSAQTLEGLNKKPVPFPTDESLIQDAENQLIDLIYKKIQ